jgi:hypothetical protein
MRKSPTDVLSTNVSAAVGLLAAEDAVPVLAPPSATRRSFDRRPSGDVVDVVRVWSFFGEPNHVSSAMIETSTMVLVTTKKRPLVRFPSVLPTDWFSEEDISSDCCLLLFTLGRSISCVVVVVHDESKQPARTNTAVESCRAKKMIQ